MHLFDHNSHYFEENAALLRTQQEMADAYRQQPERTGCKICGRSLDEATASITRLDVEFCVCERCGHLNGLYRDTEEFVEQLRDDEETDYSESYIEENREDYMKRLEDIYRPKVEFLFEALRENGETPSDLRYADFGSGSGYLIKALTKQGVELARGYEVSDSQTEYAERMVPEGEFVNVDRDEIYDVAESVDANVVSMIFTLEHLHRPVDIMERLGQNPDVDYVFFSVPLVSPAVLLEAAFESVAARQLVGPHTHLFRESSIDYLCEQTGFERTAEWWFGQDALDFARMISLQLREDESQQGAADIWDAMITDSIDDLQAVFDGEHSSSEVHLLVESTAD